jgi:membrane protein DedA with SNARE-associated domain
MRTIQIRGMMAGEKEGAVSRMFHLDTGALTSLLAGYGYLAVLLFVAIESTGIPVPGETMLVVASIYAGTTHRLEIGLVIAAAAAGAILGDNLGYLAGKEGGYRILQRYGKYVRLDEDKLRLGQYLFERHGGKMVFFGRFFPVLRIWAAFLAGTNHMRWYRFLAFNAGGGIVWATVMGLGAFALGDTVFHLGGFMGIGSAVLGIVLMGVLSIALQRNEHRLQQEANRTLAAPEAADAAAAAVGAVPVPRPARRLSAGTVLHTLQRINWAPASALGGAFLVIQPHLKPQHLSLTRRHQLM